jgi:multidrug efflux pump subunit AcrA (membrane-fusion protein)
MLKLAQTNVLYVEALLPADVYRQITAGLEADVTPEMLDGGSHRAKVAIIDRVLDAASDTFGVRLELPNPRGELLAGVRCKVSFSTVKLPAAIRPANAERNAEVRGGRAVSRTPVAASAPVR